MALIHTTGMTFITLASAIPVQRDFNSPFHLNEVAFLGIPLATPNYSLTFDWIAAPAQYLSLGGQLQPFQLDVYQ